MQEGRTDCPAIRYPTATRTYDAFGMLQSTTGTPKGPFGFAGSHGYQEDSDTGLKLLGHRYYDPSTGRFLTRGRSGTRGTEPLATCGRGGVDREGGVFGRFSSEVQGVGCENRRKRSVCRGMEDRPIIPYVKTHRASLTIVNGRLR